MDSLEKREQELVLDVSLQSKPVKLRQADGSIRIITVNQLPAPQIESWMDANASTMDYGVENDKLVIKGIKTFKGCYETLLCKCIFDEEGNPVPLSEIRSWPMKAQKRLFDIAQDINAVTEEGQKKAKNE